MTPWLSVDLAKGVSISLSYPLSVVYIKMPAADELLIRYRLHRQSMLQESVEQQALRRRETAIKPEHKLIEVVCETDMTNRPLLCPQSSAFQVRGDPIDARHDHMDRIPAG
jgi:hypothetical protein